MNRIKLIVLLVVLASFSVGSTMAQGLDLFDATNTEDGTLLIEHLNSFHNCCLIIGHDVDVVGFTIFITETEPYITGCWCECYFDVELIVSDLPQGTYTIEYTYDLNAAVSHYNWVTEIFTIEVGSWSGPVDEPAFFSTHSDCHGGDSVDVESVWLDGIKAFYR